MCINIEEEQSEKESEENQENKLVEETLKLNTNNLDFQISKSIPRQKAFLYNPHCFIGVVTPPPEKL